MELHALIDEAVLEREIGGPAVMTAQLDHLLAANKLPNITIQVIPKDHDAHGAMSGTLFLLSFVDGEDSAYVESVMGIEAVDNEDVAAPSAVWDEVAAAAPTPAESLKIIRAVSKARKR